MNAARASQQCGECGSTRPDSWILHNVRHKSNYRLLCTHCLLSSFRGNFCHHCFDVFLPLDSPSAPRASQRVLCLHCPSISHLSCLSPNSNPNSAASSDQFRCPVCADPEFRFFRVGDGRRVVTREAMRAVVAAARIAAETMRKGAATARVEAEKRVKEAAVARKRAREALERVAYLSMKEKEKKGVVRDTSISNGKEEDEGKLKVPSFGANARSNNVGGVLGIAKEDKNRCVVDGNNGNNTASSNHHCSDNGVNNGVMNAGGMVTSHAAIKPSPTSSTPPEEGNK